MEKPNLVLVATEAATLSLGQPRPEGPVAVASTRCEHLAGLKARLKGLTFCGWVIRVLIRLARASATLMAILVLQPSQHFWELSSVSFTDSPSEIYQSLFLLLAYMNSNWWKFPCVGCIQALQGTRKQPGSTVAILCFPLWYLFLPLSLQICRVLLRLFVLIHEKVAVIYWLGSTYSEARMLGFESQIYCFLTVRL